MDELTRRRLGLVIFLLAAFTAVLVYRLVSVQVVQGAAYVEKGLRQRTRDLHFPLAPRGQIRDRNGVAMAGDRVRYIIRASPPYIAPEEIDDLAERLAPILERPAADIADLLRSDLEGKVLERDATEEQVQAVLALGERGLYVVDSWQRAYPQGELTAYVVGFVGEDGVGYYGLEGFYDRSLRPTEVERRMEADAVSDVPIPLEEGDVLASIPGEDLETTIDLAVQTVAAEELARGLEEFGAERGIVIVMDPRTGAVLAMVVLPSYDPQRYFEYAGEEREVLANPAISLQYEPGSVFKIVTMAAALDSGSVTPDTTYVDEGAIECGGVRVENWDRRAHGVQDMWGVMINSLNTGVTWLTCQVMGPDVFYRYVRAFGFGQLTGVDLEGEITGEVHFPGDLDWNDSFLATNAYGQGIAVTPLQMAAAVAAVANDGRLMQPYLVERRVEADGTSRIRRPVIQSQPISPQTARMLTEMLVRVVEEGAPLAQVPGYRVAGKTGTAQIPLPWGAGYDPSGTIASFVGFGPVPDPQVVVLVRLDRPKASPWGSQTAAVVFSRLASRLFPMLGTPPGE